MEAMKTEQKSTTPWRDVDQAAERALTGKRAIYAAIKSGRLRAVCVNGRRDIRTQDAWIDEWLLAEAAGGK